MPANTLEKLKRLLPDAQPDDAAGKGPQGAIVEALEPRTLFSADLLGVAALDSLDPTDQINHALVADPPAALELVFVDSAVSGIDDLMADFEQQQRDGRNLHVHVLDSERDGIEQLSRIIADNRDVTAVHIFSHGTASGLQLGSSWITQQSIIAAQPAMHQWQQALADDADFLLYGCDLASDADGQRMLELWARATGGNVAASTDTTGHTQRGGDWTLEHTTGPLDTAVALSDGAQDDWLHELAVFPQLTVTTFADIEDGDTSGVQALIDNPGADGEISLREAIEAADNEDGHDEIYLPDGRYQRSDDGELSIDSDITLRGESQHGTIIDAELKSRVIHIPGDHTVVFENLQLVNGSHSSKGGAIDAHANSDVTFRNVSLIGNVSGDRGGAVLSDGGIIRFDNVTASGNTAAQGGAVELKGATFIAENSVFYDNFATVKGGAISGEEAVQTLTNVTLYDNSSAQAGGISTVGNGSVLTLNNSTLSGNRADDDGGAIRASQPVYLNNTTIAYNEAGTDGSGAGGGLHLSGSATVDMSNSILESNTAASAGSGNAKNGNKITSLGHNIDSDGTAMLAGAGDISNTSALLAPLAAGESGLPTHALLAGSPGIDAGDPNTAEPRDSNDLLRSSTPDIGASEAGSTTLTGTPGPVDIDGYRDVLWESKSRHEISRISYAAGTNSGASDISASWQSTWDSEHLYFYVDVADDVAISAESDAGTPFNDDSVEIFLDPNYSRGTAYDGVDDIQLLIDRGTAGVQLLGASAVVDVNLIESAVVDTGDGYSVEVAIPWSELGISSPATQSIGVDVHVNDDDDGDGRDTRIEWGDGNNSAYQRVDVLGTGELAAAVDNAAPTHLHGGIALNADGGNNQYLEMDGGIPSDLTQFTVEVTFTATQTGAILSVPIPGMPQPMQIAADIALADGNLHTISVSWDNVSNSLNVYHDGVLASSLALSPIGGTFPQGSYFILGQSYDGAAFDASATFSGTLYDIRLWDQSRSAQQIVATLNHQFDSAAMPDGLQINWQMRELQGSGTDTIVNAVNPGTGDLKLKSIATSATWLASSAITELSVAEHNANGSAIGYIYPTDPETETSSFQFALTDDAGGRFAIDATTGLLRVADGANVDFEATPTHNVTVQVTDDTGDSYEQTFAIALDAINEPPALDNAGGDPTIYILGQPAVAIDPNIAPNDPELSNADNYDGATLTIARQGGANGEDNFAASADLGALTEGGPLTLAGTGTIGSVQTNSGGELVLLFNGNATQAVVTSAMRSIAYSNSGSHSTPATISLNWTFDDANDGSQGDNGALATTSSVDVTVSPHLLNAIDDDLGTITAGSDFTFTTAQLIGNDVSAFGVDPELISVSDPSTGSLVDNNDGSYTYSSSSSDTGAVTFDYDIETPDTRIHPDTQSLWTLSDDASDSVGGNNGVVHGTTTTADGLYFDGTDDYIELSSITYADNFTFSFDFKLPPVTSNGYTPIFENASGTDSHSFSVTLQTSTFGGQATLITFIMDDDDLYNFGDNTSVTTLVNDGNWHRYTATVERGVGTKVYIDGALKLDLERGRDDFQPTAPVYIGRNDALNEHLDSSRIAIRNVQLYDSALALEDTVDPPPITSTGTATLTLRNEEVVATNLALDAAEGQAVTIGQANLQTTDSDAADTADALQYTLLRKPTTGDLLLNDVALVDGDTFTQADIDNNRLEYLHNGAESTGADSFDFTVDDDAGTVSSGTFNLNIVDVNDSPEVASNNPLSIAEGDTTPIDTANLQATDADDDATELLYTVTTPPQYGHIALASSPDDAILSFSQDAIDQGQIVYRHHGASDPDADSFDFSVADGGEDGATAATGTFSVAVSGVDDLPGFYSIAGDYTLLNSPTYIVGGAAVTIDSGVEIFDEDLLASDNYAGTTLTLQRTAGADSNDLFAASGVLTALTENADLSYAGTNIGTVTRNSTGTLILDFNASATRALVNAAMQSLSYQHVADSQSGPVSLTWHFSDGANTAQGTTEVNLLRVPTLAVATPGPIAINEDSDILLSGGDAISASHDIQQDTPLQIHLQASNGTIALVSDENLNTAAGGSATDSVVLEGLHSDIAAALSAGVIYSPDANYNGADTLAVQFSADSGLRGHYSFDGNANDSSAAGANPGTLSGGADIHNDPERGSVARIDSAGESVTVPGTFSAASNLTLATWVNLDSVDVNGADVISLGDSVALRLDSTTGGVNGLFNSGGSWHETPTNEYIEGTGWRHVVYTIDSDSNQQSLYIDGILLAQTSHADAPTYQPADNTAFGANAGSQSGVNFGGLISDVRIYQRSISEPEVALIFAGQPAADATVDLTVTAVNDAPAIAGTAPTSLSAVEDEISTFDFSALSVSDSDAATANLQLTISSDNPLDTLIVNNGTGLTIAGQNSAAVSLTGDATAINNWLASANALQYQPPLHSNGVAAANLTLAISDLGNSGSGGAKTVELDAIAIDITAVNDPPVGQNSAVTIDEDASYIFGLDDFALTDPNDSPANSLDAVVITALPANGLLSITGNPVSAGQSIARSDIENGELLFQPAPHAHGTAYASVSFAVVDDGGTANGGIDTALAANTITIDVAPVNDAPAGSDTRIEVPEDTTYIFSVADFGYSDVNDGDNLLGVRIDAIPLVGELRLNSVAVSNSDVITVADISAALLRYTPAPDENGSNYSSLTFTVIDDGANSSGAPASDTSANTIDIDILAVNDPVAIINSAASIDEDDGDTVITTSMLYASDVDHSASQINYTVSAQPQFGYLELDSQPGTLVTSFTQEDINTGQLHYIVTGDGARDDAIELTVSDAAGGTATPTVFSITVATTNDAPSFDASTAFASLGFIDASVLARDAVTQADGKTIITGVVTTDAPTFDLIVGRLNSDGSIDTDFSDNGYTAFDIYGTFDDSTTLTMLPDGGIAVGVATYRSDAGYVMAVLKLGSDGAPDTAFGTDGLGVYIFTSAGPDWPWRILGTDDGKILVAGSTSDGGDSDNDLAVIKINSDGSPDTSFSGDGFLRFDHDNADNRVTGLGVQSDGSMLFSLRESGDVIRFNADGTQDTAFGNSGAANVTATVQNLLVLPDDSILLVGNHNDNAIIAKLTADGTLDPSFATGGVTETDFGGIERFYDIAVQSDGKILIGGHQQIAGEHYGIAARFSADGQLDATFGSGGHVLSHHAVSDLNNYFQLAIEPDDSFTMTLVQDLDSRQYTELHSFHPNGNPDYRYNPSTIQNTLGGNLLLTEGDAAALIDDDVRVYDQELSRTNDFANTSLSLSRAGAANDADHFSASGLLGPLLEGSDLIFDGDVIGTVSQNSNGALQLFFSTGANSEQVNGVLQSIAYRNSSQDPETSITLNWLFNDGNSSDAQGLGGELTVTGQTTISITPVNQAPAISQHSATLINGVGGYVLTSANLQTTDVDNDPSELQYTLDAITPHIALRLNGIVLNVGDTFTQRDIDDGDVTLDHDGDPAASASFDVTVSDGEFSSSDTISITVENNTPHDLASGIAINSDGGNSSYFLDTSNYNYINSLTEITREFAFSALVPNSAGFSTLYSAADSAGNTEYLAIHPDGQVEWHSSTLLTTSLLSGTSYIDPIVDFPDLFDLGYHSIAITTDLAGGADSIKLYVDGRLAGSASTPASADTASGDMPWVIGQRQTAELTFDPASAFSGTLHDVRIWDNIRNESEINANRLARFDNDDLPVGLIVNWQMTSLNGGATIDNLDDSTGANGLPVTLQLEHASGSGFVHSNPIDELTIADDAANGDLVGFVTARDLTPDAGGYSYSLSGEGSTLFAVQAGTGAITVADASGLNALDQSTYNLVVDVSGTETADRSYSQIVPVTLLSVNEPPQISTPGAALSIAEQASASALEPNILIVDEELDSIGYAGSTLTLQRASGIDANDEFHATDSLAELAEGGAIEVAGVQLGTVTQNSAGRLLLTFDVSASAELVNQVARQIGYRYAGDTPPDTLPIEWAFDDQNTGLQGAGSAGIASVDSVVNIAAANDAPQLTNLNASVAYTENAQPVVLDTDVQIFDPELHASHYSDATLSIARSAGASADDVFSGTGLLGPLVEGGTFSYDGSVAGSVKVNSNGTLELLFGTITTDTVNDILRAIAYSNTSEQPPSEIVLNWQFNDGNSTAQGSGGSLLASGSQTIAIEGINDAPTLSGLESAAISYVEGDAAVRITDNLTIADVDGTTLNGATISIDSGYAPSEDELTFSPVTGISSNWDSGTGVLTLQGDASHSAYETALRSVHYVNHNSDAPSGATRIISFSVSDATDASLPAARTLNFQPVNDAPTLSASTAAIDYIENSAALQFAADIVVADVDGDTITGATISFHNGYQVGEDQLTFSSTGAINGQWDDATGTLTLTGDASVAQYQSALRAVGYLNASDDPDTQTRALTITVNDDSDESEPLQISIDPVAINDAPSIALDSATATYQEAAASVLFADALTLVDVDSPILSHATVTILNNYQRGEDVLLYTDSADITGSWNADTGTLTLTGDATVEQFQAALGAVSYVNNNEDDPHTGERTLAISAHDGTDESSIATIALSIQAVNDPPMIVATAVDGLAFVEGGPAVSPGANISLSDVDNASVHSALIRIDDHYRASEDLLLFEDTANISANWDASRGELQLSGLATIAEYQSALRAVQYHNSSDNPDTAPRTLVYTANDGAIDSTAAALVLPVVAVNDPPAAANATIELDEDSQHVFATDDFGFDDALDNHAFQAIEIVAPPGAGELVLNSANAVAGQLVTASDIASGALIFTPAEHEFGANYANFSFRVIDSGGTANGGLNTSTDAYTITLRVNPVDDAPSAIVPVTHLHVEENSSPGTVIGRLTGIDPDPATNAISDGGFTSVATPLADANTYSQGDMLGDWLVASGGVDARGSDWQPSPGGGKAVDLNSMEPGSLEQTFATVPGAQYRFDLQLAGNFRADADELSLQVGIAGQSHTFPVTKPSDWSQQNLYWQGHTISFTATGATTTITLSSMTPGAFGPLISDLALLNSVQFSAAGSQETVDVMPDGTLLVGANSPDYESSDTIALEVQATDVDGLSFTDTITIEVEDLNESPSAAMDTELVVEDGTRAVITGDHLRASDPDQADAAAGRLHFTLVAAPQHGQILFGDNELNIGDAFSQQDIDDGLLSYAHAGGDTPHDLIEFVLADGGEDGAVTVDVALPVLVDHVNESPVLESIAAIELLEGGTFTLTSDHLQASDGDSRPTQLHYVIDDAPQYGRLYSTDDPTAELSRFSQRDIDDEKIFYLHAGGDEPSDRFNFTLFDQLDDDGAAAASASIEFNIIDVADAPYARDNSIQTFEQAPVTIAIDDLGFSDQDDGDNLAWAEIETLPSSGELALNGQAVSAGQWISAAALEAGALVYHPASDASVGDRVAIVFRVGDDGSLSNGGANRAEQPNTLTIQIGDSTPSVVSDDNIAAIQRGSISSLADGSRSVLDNDSDADTPRSQLVAVLVDATRHGSIELFEDGTFRYVHDGSDNFSDSFSYRVIDGNPADDVSVSDTGFVEIAIEPLPPAPNAGQLPDQIVATYDQLTVALPEGLFTSNADDAALRYTATLENGDPLPAWLTFDPITGIFSGKPELTDIGELSIEITAIDVNDKATSSLFMLTIEPSLDAALDGPDSAPEIPAPDTTAAEPTPAIAQSPVDTGPIPTTDSSANSSAAAQEPASAAAETEPLFAASEDLNAERDQDTFEDTVVKNDGTSSKTEKAAFTQQSLADPIFTASLERLFFSGDESTLESARNLIDKLDREREENAELAQRETQVVASAITVSTGLSIGYIVWLVRGGLLVGSVLTSMPAWRWIDPLPVLSNLDGDLDDDDESLQSMVDKKPASEPDAPEPDTDAR